MRFLHAEILDDFATPRLLIFLEIVYEDRIGILVSPQTEP